MDRTPNLLLPYIMAAQAQKHVTHNEAIRALDAILQLAVADRDLAVPPASPANGDCYIVAASPSGSWSGQAGRIAAFQDGGWVFFEPRRGWRAWVADEQQLVVWSGATWTGATSNSTNPMPLAGINCTADTTNRLSVKSNAALLSHDDVTPGTGDFRAVVNKSAAGKTASFLFQDAFSGRAEVGLCGDDDFHFKVSPDGVAWKDAIVIDRATGIVAMPFNPARRELLTAARTYYVRPDGNDANTGLANTAGGAFRTIQKAIDTAGGIDTNIYAITVQIADGTYNEAVSLKTVVGAGKVVITGNTSTPANVVVNAVGGNCFTADTIVGQYEIGGVKVQGGTGFVVAGAGVRVAIANIDFGACTGNHMVVVNQGYLLIYGNYTISGGAAGSHVAASFGHFESSGHTVTITGAPAFGVFVSANQLAYVQINGNTWNGAATGTRYSVGLMALVYTGTGGSASYLPGNAAGSTNNGGLYS